MTSPLISRASAGLLLAAGMALLFVPDVVLPGLVSGYPVEALWIGQLLGAAWLGVAGLNWMARATILGGIYGRPIVIANLAIYFIGGLVLLRAAEGAGFPPGLSLLLASAALPALAYGWLLFRGPLQKDLDARGTG